MTVQAFFWDYDNTILETAESHWIKHQVVLAKYGITLKEVFRKRVYENNGYQNWAWMKDELGLEVSQEEYLKEIDLEFQKHITDLEMRSGVAELFELLESLEIPQAIITNARRDSAEPILKAKGILPKMKFVLYKEDYEGRKPDPTPYLAGIQMMQEAIKGPISTYIAIEDDPKGVESAFKAGAIVIHRKLTEDAIPTPYAHYTCFTKDDLLKIALTLLKK